MFANTDSIRQLGFEGFVTVSELWLSRCSQVPSSPGVYLVLHASKSRPEFLDVGSGGYFKKRNPNVSVELLERNWVDGAVILNIGKAGGGGQKATLRSRLNCYMQFGQTKAVPHTGGRFIWQLGCSHDLQVCWKVLPADSVPRAIEKELILKFEQAYGSLPFANLKH